MSNTIEQRVVEMRFDNSHFAKGVSSTLSMLEKLKEKLNFSGATKGLDDINNSVKKVDMGSLGGAVDTVSAKFSALQVMGVTALANITNSAINTGKQIVKSLTVEPVSDGFKEYELTLNAVQTTMAGTGKTAKEVELELKKLDEYADKTVYSTADMLNNLPKFTNAGVDLEKATTAMIGIANATALAGGDAGKASIAFYNLGQAIGTGYLTRMDYNSINNAGIATMEWKEQMIEAAIAQGTLTKIGEDAYKAGNKTLTLQQLFIDGLQEQWATTDVLMQVFGDYGDETTKVGKKAYAAAQDIKTYTQMMESLKATAGTGWKDTWQLLIGDLDQAKGFWTTVTNGISGVITKMADARNELLGDTLNSNWDKFNDRLNAAGVKTEEFEQSLKKVVGGTKFKALTSSCESFEEAVRKGKFSSDELKKALDGIAETKAETKIASFVEGLKDIEGVLRRGDVGEDVEKLQAALDELGFDIGDTGIDGIIGPATEKAIKEFQKLNDIKADGIVGPDTIKALEEAGKEVEEISRNVDELKSSCDSLIDVITETSGRELLLDSLKNIVQAIIKPVKALGKAWGETFSLEPSQLYAGLKALNRFSKALVISDESAEKLTRTFKGLLSIVKIITTIAGGAFKLAFTGLTVFLERFDMDLLDFTAMVGDALTAISDFIDGVIDSGFNAIFDWLLPKLATARDAFAEFRTTVKEALSGIIESIGSWFASLKDIGLFTKMATLFSTAVSKIAKAVGTATKTIVDGIGKWITKIKETEVFKSCAEWFSNAAETISDAIDNITTKISEFDVSSIMEKLGAFGSFMSNIGSKIKNSEIFITFISAITEAFSKLRDSLPKFKLPELNLDKFTSFSKLMAKFEGIDISNLPALFAKLGEHYKGLFQMNWNKFKNNTLQKFVSFWLKSGDMIKAAFDKCKEVALALKNFIFGTEEVTLPNILNVVEKFLIIITLLTALKTLKALTAPFDNITSAINNFANARKWDAIGDAFKAMAIALGTFTVCLLVISKMDNVGKATGILLGLIAAMTIAVSAMAFFVSKIDGGIDTAATAGALLMVIGAIALLVHTLKQIDNLDLKHPVKTFLSLGGILIALTAGIKMVSMAAGSSFSSIAAILTLMAALKMILDVLDAYDQYDWTGKTDAIWHMVDMLVVLSLAIRIASGGIKAGSSAQGLAMLVLAMAISLKILYSAINDFASMDTATLAKGGLVVAALLGVMTLMATSLAKANRGMVLERGQKSVNNFTGLAVALLAVVASIWLLGKMDLKTLTQGGIAVIGILSMFTIMLSSVGKACKGLKMGALITMLVSIGLLIAEIAVVIYLLRGIPWQQAVGSAGALTMLMLAMAGTLRVLTKHHNSAKTIVKWIGAMTALAGVIVILAYILTLIKDINPLNAIGNVIALDILLAGMAGVLITLTKHRNGAKSIFKWIGAMAALGLVVAELALVLQLIKDIDPINAIGNVIALDLLLVGMSVCLTTLTKHRNNAKTIFKWIGAMAAFGLVVAELALVLHLIKDLDPVASIGNVIALSTLLLAVTAALTIMSACKVKANLGAIGALALVGLVAAELVGVMYLMKGLDPAKAIPQVMALSILVTVLSLVLIPLTAIGSLGVAAITGVGVLAVLATSLFILVGVLATMSLVSNATANAKVLGGLITVLSLVLIPLTVVGAFGVAAITGVGVLAVLMKSLFIVVDVLASMQGIKNAQINADILIELLTVMTDALVKISLLAPLAVVGVTALAALIILVGALGVFAVAIGALLEHFPIIEKFVDVGLELFKKLAGGLGEMVSAFAVGLTDGLAEAGDNLSDFIESVTPFIDGVKGITDDVVTGAGNLAAAVLMFLGTEFLAGIADKTGGSLSDFAIELSAFGEDIGGFIESMSAVKPETATGVKALCDAINALTSANFKDAITQLFPGDNSLSSFGANIKEFAGCLKDASASLADITDADVENIKRSAAAGEALAALNKSIPSQDGWLQNIIGSKELGPFGQSIDAFADCLVSYSEKISGKNFDPDAITASAAAGKALAELNGAIPAQGGWAQNILGSQDMASFGASIVAFGDCLTQYSAKVSSGTIDKEAIINSADAAEALATLNGKLPSQNGLWQAVAGEKDLGEFGTKLISFANGILAYANAAAQIDDTKITAITNSGKAVDELVAVTAKIPETGGWGESVLGASDPQSFGAGLSSLASGIVKYCEMAATIGEDDIAAITNTGTAITELGTIMTGLPDAEVTQKTTSLKTAVTELTSVGSAINNLTIAEYDYSGLDTLKTEISKVATMLNDVDTTTMQTKYASLSTAILDAVLCAEKLNTLNGFSYEGVTRLKDAIKTLGEVSVDEIIRAFSGRSADIAAAIDTIVVTMAERITSVGSSVYGAMADVVSKTLETITKKNMDFRKAGRTLAIKLSDGLKDKRNTLLETGKSIAGEVVDGVEDKYDAMEDAGKDLGDGLVIGIESKVEDAYEAGYKLGQAAVQGERDGQRSASPSKATIQAGKWLGEGLVIGIDNMGKAVYRAGSSMGSNAVKSISRSISRISDIVESDIDAQPTIRPVLDLSNVESGAGYISSLLSSGNSVGVMANVNAISGMMNRRGQNGADSEVVSAINKLRRDLGNVGNTTYNVNGVTYDDGSNVSGAVKELIRAARIERRV